MKKFFLIAIMISFPFFWSCGAQNNERKRIELDETQQVYAEAGNDFAFRFLKQIDACESGDWFVSPVSLQYLLGLVLDGSEGATADEICRTLGYPAGQAEAVDAYCRKMLAELPHLDKKTKLTLANAIFFNDKMEIKVPYKKRVEKFYDAALTMLDMVWKDILPAVTAYSKVLTDTALSKKALSDHLDCSFEADLVDRISCLTSAAVVKAKELREAVAEAKNTGSTLDLACVYKDTVFAAMNDLRAVVDELETLTASKYWPYPTYGEILFSVK